MVERIVPMRLQKFLARAGVASRRGSENLMTAGRVTVNGEVVTELGSKVDPRVDVVAVDGIVVSLSDVPVVLAFNKPKGVLTTMVDPHGRPCVASLVPTDRYPGLFPIGRLDMDTTGLLLFTTDGDLGHALLHPSRHVEKRYLARVRGVPHAADISRLCTGIELEDGMTAPARVRILKPQHSNRGGKVRDKEAAAAGKQAVNAGGDAAVGGQVADGQVANSQVANSGGDAAASAGGALVEVCIHEGRKRQVRRMLEAIGHPVVSLQRTDFGPIHLGTLQSGTWRELTDAEREALYAAVGLELPVSRNIT